MGSSRSLPGLLLRHQPATCPGRQQGPCLGAQWAHLGDRPLRRPIGSVAGVRGASAGVPPDPPGRAAGGGGVGFPLMPGAPSTQHPPKATLDG